MNRCSFCGEPIAVGTVVCRWCGRRQPDAPLAIPKKPPAGPKARIAGWLGRYNRELTGAGISLMAVAVLGLVWVTVTRMAAQVPAAAAPLDATLTAAAGLAQAITPTAPAPAPTDIIMPAATLAVTAIPTTVPTAAPATGTPSPTPNATPTAIATLSADALPEAVVKLARLALRRVPGDSATMAYAWPGTSVKVLGRARGQSWVLAQIDTGLQGWIPALPDQLGLDVPLAALPVSYFRPATGVIAGKADLTGAGVLVIGGHPTEDTVIILASEQLALFAVYVHAHQDYALPRVPDGTYTLYRVGGADWDGYEFKAVTKRERFEAPFEFKTSPGVYTIWRIDLDPASRAVYTRLVIAPADVPKVVPDTALESPAAEGR